jgi:hypothetical protein
MDLTGWAILTTSVILGIYDTKSLLLALIIAVLFTSYVTQRSPKQLFWLAISNKPLFPSSQAQATRSHQSIIVSENSGNPISNSINNFVSSLDQDDPQEAFGAQILLGASDLVGNILGILSNLPSPQGHQHHVRRIEAVPEAESLD